MATHTSSQSNQNFLSAQYKRRERDADGHSNKHRVYVEYHRRLYSDVPASAMDIDAIARAANATGIKTDTIRSSIADWRRAEPRGIPPTVRENPLHVAAVGDDPEARRAALARYDGFKVRPVEISFEALSQRNEQEIGVPSDSFAANADPAESVTRRHTGAGYGDPGENKLVKQSAIRAVMTKYEASGWSVRSVESEKCGYDLICTKEFAVEKVEVKGVRGASPCFIITAGEIKQARTNPDFVLIVVTSALSKSPKLTKYSGAAFCERFELSAIQYRAVLKR